MRKRLPAQVVVSAPTHVPVSLDEQQYGVDPVHCLLSHSTILFVVATPASGTSWICTSGIGVGCVPECVGSFDVGGAGASAFGCSPFIKASSPSMTVHAVTRPANATNASERAFTGSLRKDSV